MDEVKNDPDKEKNTELPVVKTDDASQKADEKKDETAESALEDKENIPAKGEVKKEAQDSSPESGTNDISNKGSEEKTEAVTGQDAVTGTILDRLTHDEKRFFLSLAGFSTFVSSTTRLFWTNFLMGMARGIGFVIGVSIIGAVCVGIWNEILSVTGLGRFIANIIEEIHRNAPK